MDGAHLHLILNHIPVFGLLVGFLLLVWGMIRGYDEVQKAALVTLFLTAATALPVYLRIARAGTEIRDWIVSARALSSCCWDWTSCICFSIWAARSAWVRSILSNSWVFRSHSAWRRQRPPPPGATSAARAVR